MTMDASTNRGDLGLPPHEQWRAMTAVALSVSMAGFDLSIVNTALPHIAAQLGIDPASSVWVVSAYQLSLIATLLPFASLGEIVGHKRIYMSGMAVFCIASALCGAAGSLPMLVAARVLQGVGASAMVSVNVALIRFIYPPHRFGRGLAFNTLVVGASFTAGPSLASAILSVAEWPYLFFVNLPLGLTALVLGQRYLPRNPLSKHPFDPLAAVLTGALFVLIVLAIDSFGHGGGWRDMAGYGSGAALCLALLVRRQSGHPAPILALDLYRVPMIAMSSFTGVCAFITQGTALVALPFLFTAGFGMSQVEAGLFITPWPAMVALLATVSVRLADRFTTALLGGIGLLGMAAGMALLATMPAHPTGIEIVWRMILCGAGFGMFQAPNIKALMLSAPAGRAGGASGIIAVTRNLGQASGAALAAVCFNLAPDNGPRTALFLGCAFAVCGGTMSLMRLRAKSPTR
jgi:MFS transporter, DHA2 family, multidrug resistance protein